MDYLIKRTAKTERYECKDDFIDRLLDITSIAEDTGAETLTMSITEDCGGTENTVRLEHLVNMLDKQIEKYMDLVGKELNTLNNITDPTARIRHIYRATKYVGIYRGLMVVMNTYSLPRFDRLVKKYEERENTVMEMTIRY